MRIRNPDFGALDPGFDSAVGSKLYLWAEVPYAYKSWIIESGGQLVLRIVFAGDVPVLNIPQAC